MNQIKLAEKLILGNPDDILESLDPAPIDLPTNTFEWIKVARPFLGKRKRNFDLSPYWIDIYEDNHPNIMAKCARQTFKTTTATDIIACAVTSKAGIEVSYVADNEAHKTAFSKQRLRNETFKANDILRKFLRNDRAAVSEINLSNDSVVYLLTDEGEYKAVEGKSNTVLVCDEYQYHDVQYIFKALYTMTMTHGRFYGFGIGGEQGSPYGKQWARTDQREWFYDDPNWRSNLTFDSQGNISNNSKDIKGILAGRWIAQKPENTQFRGYHIPQTIVPLIPLTIHSAIHEYQIQPELSIEYQKKHFPHSIYLSHTLAEDYKAERRPITPEMIENVMDKHFTFLTPNEVVMLKLAFGNEIRVTGGVDFGSSTTVPTTVASVNIHWKKSDRTQMVFMERIPQGDHPADKARHIVEIFRNYGCDFSVGDWGHGQDMIPLIQHGGRDSHDEHFVGLTRSKFMGCRTIGDPTKPLAEYTQATNDKGIQELAKITIDKTTTIQAFIDLFGQFVSHPLHPDNEELKRPIYIIPSGIDYETDWLIDDWTKLTRVDLEQDINAVKENTKQQVMKQFSHPPDSLMSQIYCFVALNNYQPSQMSITGVGKRK